MSSPQPYKEVQTLVIRANVGDEIKINLYNSFERKVSMHIQGLHYDILILDGANVGKNPDTTQLKNLFGMCGMRKKKAFICSLTQATQKAVRKIQMYMDCLGQ